MLKAIFLLTIILKVASPTTYSGATVEYSWDTDNNESYMCKNMGVEIESDNGLNSHLICAQTEFPSTQGGEAWEIPTFTCPQGTIKCFVYATFGRAGGRCDGDEFKDDPSGQWTYVPEALLADQVIGKSTFTFSIDEETINGVDASITIDNEDPSNRLKVLAYCDSDDWSSSSFLTFNMMLFLLLSLII